MITDKGFSTKVTDEDIAKGIKDEFGAVYSSDGKRLIKGVNSPAYHIKPGTQVICDDAFVSCRLTNIVIPDSITHIGNYAFYKCSGLSSITIPKSVSYIGERAFYNCRNLRSIVLPESVTHIGNSAFSYCEKLSEINIPNSVTQIGDEVFTDCYCLANITIPNSITHIGNKAFLSCNSLTHITIPDSIAHIGDKAFFYCVALTEITIPDSVTHIGKHAFEGCRRMSVIRVSGNNPIFDSRDNCNAIIETASNTLLVGCKNTIIPDSISRIGDYAFYGCEALTEIVIPDSVKQIGNFAFYGCKDLNSITIPRFASHIGSHAFSGCSALAEISLPDSITHIGDNAFYPCNAISVINAPARCYDRYKQLLPGFENIFHISDLKDSAVPRVSTRVTVEDKTNGVIDEFGALYSLDGKRLLKGANTASYSIKPGTQVICDKAFINCTGLERVTIPNSVTHFGDEVFFSCSSLSRIIIPDSVIYIGIGAFSFCNALIRISIPDSVTLIGDSVFSHCEALTSVNISNSVTYIGDRAFSECESLTSITIPDTVTHIGEEAFSSCSSLASITLPNSITHIGKGVFSYCSSLANVTIPDSVTQIDDYAFSECESLASITIPDSVLQIGKEAFCDCSGLESITLPDAVTHIGELAFNRCSGLTRIQVSDNNKMYDSRGDCNAIIQTATNTLITGCKNTIIPDSVTHIGKLAFGGCTGLINMTIPNSITNIGDYAFSGCEALTSITFPDSVTHIGDRVFIGCDAIAEIRIPAGSFDKFKDLLTGLEEKFCIIDPTEPHDTQFLTEASNEDIAEGIEDEFGALYSPDGKRLLRGPRTTFYSIKPGTQVICDLAFNGCARLTNIIIPGSVTHIGSEAFSCCSALTEIYIPKSVSYIGESAFISCDSLANVCIPDSVTSIRNCTFLGCGSLIDITIPDSITSIGNAAFHGCESLTSIIIPGSVNHLGESLFFYCDDLTSIQVSCNNKMYDSRGNCNAIIQSATNTLIIGCKNTIIPNSVSRIGSGAFSFCRGLTEITIPDSVTHIGTMAFLDCNALASVTIPNSVTHIENGAFSGCDALVEIRIPAGSTAKFKELLPDMEDKFVENSLPNNSNSNHTAINEVSTETSDKVYSREQLESLKKVTKDDAANAWKDEFGVFYSEDKTRLLRAPKNISEYSIPEGTRIICDWAFGECESLRSVELCESLIAIGFRAFHECTSLKTIVVPGSIKEIDTAAFFSCDSLQTATILEGVEIIGEEAFNCCSALQSIDLPNSLTTIGDWAFAGCGSLKSFSIPSSVTHIGREVFELCDCKIINKSEYFRTNGFDLYSVKNKTLIYCSPSIVKYNIPDSVSIIGHYAFFDCAKLKSIVIPDTVTRIEDGAFCGCSFLSRIILSKSLTDIGDNAFSSCKCLKSIILPESIVNIGKKPFESCDSLTVIYVPKGTLARFEELLSDNKDIIKEIENQDGLNNDNQARIANEYHILEIYPSEDGRYGDIIVIEANPVEERPGGKAIVQHHYNGTEIFFFPHDSLLIQPILRIAQSRGLWSPNPDDYEDEIVTRESTNRDVLIHRHVSFWDEDFDRSMNRGKRTISIPNSQLKVQQLTQQYINGGWNSLYTLREYIESLAEGEDVENFCGWLFDNPSLNGKFFWELDDEYVKAYVDFLNQFI